jgi:hypothetical protein
MIWYVVQMLIMGAVTAAIMPDGNPVASAMVGWFCALLVSGLLTRVLSGRPGEIAVCGLPRVWRAILIAERRAPKQPAAPAFKTARDVPTMGRQPCLARWTRLAAAPVRDPDVSPRQGRPCLLNLPAHNGPLACFPLFFRWLAAVPAYRSPKAPFPRRGRRAVDSLVHQVVSYLK